MPLLVPVPKQVGGASVPVTPVLSKVPEAGEQPFAETVIANSQSLPGACEKTVVNDKTNENTSNIFFMIIENYR
jgi:hypothetical protein